LVITEEFAEMLGVLLGDGCVCKYTPQGRYRYVVASTGSFSEYWYYEQIVQPTSINEFGVVGSLDLRKDGTTRYHIYGESVARALLGFGVPLGRKHDAFILPLSSRAVR
jgi:hypothetical protein